MLGFFLFIFLIFICPPLELLPVLGPWERWRATHSDVDLLCSSRASSDLGLESGLVEVLLWQMG